VLIGQTLNRRFFEDRVGRLRRGHRCLSALAIAMAEVDNNPVRITEVAARAGYEDSPWRGLVDFTAPLFGGYLRDEHPLASFAKDYSVRGSTRLSGSIRLYSQRQIERVCNQQVTGSIPGGSTREVAGNGAVLWF
jgi:hypothetical protein